MSINRRSFLKSAAAGAAALAVPGSIAAAKNNLIPGSATGQDMASAGRSPLGGLSADLFSVHPFVESNPDAVFIMYTDVAAKTDSAAIRSAGMAFGRSVFVHSNDETAGIPLSHRVAIKPNLTSRGKWQDGYTVEGTMGVITDANFVEGVIESLKELGIAGDRCHVREVNGTENLTEGAYEAMGNRTGADVKVIGTDVNSLSSDKVVWRDVQDGVWFQKIPYLWPVNAPDTWLLNIAKFKTHGMGLTLCAKNLQGSIASPYQRHCTAYGRDMGLGAGTVQPDAFSDIQSNYYRHRSSIPRWDRPGNGSGGIWMETWATRCLDNNSVTHPGLHIIEGVYGRDGNFVQGPHNGLARDYMTNIILFGKNAFYVDIIGHWFGGHEPGNFGLFHMAAERGMCKTINPNEIPVFEWRGDGTAAQKSLTELQRYPLETYYLQRDYRGQDEEYWHLCNEPYQYAATGVGSGSHASEFELRGPESFILDQNYPNPFNPTTSISFSLARGGRVRLEIFNSRGEIVDRIVDGYRTAGTHLAVWHAHNLPSGTYYCRLLYDRFQQTRKMTLVK